MARDVVKKKSLQEVGERSHLWDSIEIKEVLQKNKVNHSIHGYVNSLMHCFHSNGSQC